MRCYLYALISELEMRLADIAHESLTTDVIGQHLGNRERERYEKAERMDLEMRAVEYLNFSAYKHIAKLVPAIHENFPGRQADLQVELSKLTKLRNCVAHPAKALIAEFEVGELGRLTQLAEDFNTSLNSAHNGALTHPPGA